METRHMFLCMLLYIVSTNVLGQNQSLSLESQTIIFENVRVEKVKAILTVTEENGNRGRIRYDYIIPPRQESHQPAYIHEVFHLSTVPAMLSVKIQSRRTGITRCANRFYIKNTHYLFSHHPYIRIKEDGCEIGKETLPGTPHLMN